MNGECVSRIVVDIETVACPGAAEFLEAVEAPSNYKDPLKIAAYIEDARRRQIDKAGLEADLCEVVAVGYQDEDSELPTVYTRADANEDELIKWAWCAIDLRAVVGFNSLSFDLPVLIRRSQLMGLKYPTLNLDKYRTPHVDLMERLSFNGKLTMRSLDFYCRRFAIPIHDTISGADIAALVAAGQWGSVNDHCRCDIVKTAALARRLRLFGAVGVSLPQSLDAGGKLLQPVF